MPTVLRVKGYRFIIFTNDHRPPHIHAKKADGGAKVMLDPIQITDYWRLNPRELSEILEIVQAHQDFLLGKWAELRGEDNGDPN